MYKTKSVLRYNDKTSTRYIGNVFFTDLEYKNGMKIFYFYILNLKKKNNNL
jgi:hypothetical protein